MGFMWEGSTGARAVQLLKELPQGTVIFTPQFAAMLEVKAGALHQLLANAVKLRLVKKIRGRGPCIGWAIGGGNDSATIERRRAPRPQPTAEEIERREAAAQRRRTREAEKAAALPAFSFDSSWPPGFVSTFDADRYQPAAIAIPDGPGLIDASAPVAPWLRGLVGAPVPAIRMVPPAPLPAQLPLFEGLGPGGRARWRRLALAIPAVPRPSNEPIWRQVSLLEA